MALSPAVRRAGYIALFVVSFLFFIYYTFPYEVVKESVAADVSRATGMNLTIKKLSPNFPLGLQADGVRLAANTPGAEAEFKSVDVDIGVLWLLLGQLKIKVRVTGKDGGRLWFAARIGVPRLFSARGPVPSSVTLESSKFVLDDIVHFLLGWVAEDPNTNPLLGPLLSKIGFVAKLDGNIALDLDVDEPTQSQGMAEIIFTDAMLKLSDPSLNLPDQKFSKAMIKAKLENGTLAFDDKSGLTAQEMDVGFQGKLTLKPIIGSSLIEMRIPVKMEKDLNSQFGFILDMFAGGPKNGIVTFQLRGSLVQPLFTPI